MRISTRANSICSPSPRGRRRADCRDRVMASATGLNFDINSISTVVAGVLSNLQSTSQGNAQSSLSANHGQSGATSSAAAGTWLNDSTVLPRYISPICLLYEFFIIWYGNWESQLCAGWPIMWVLRFHPRIPISIYTEAKVEPFDIYHSYSYRYTYSYVYSLLP